MKLAALWFAMLVLGCSCWFTASAACGYDACNPGIEGMINVHIVPHTHDDVGWLVTVDQYYTKEVQYILDSVLMALQQNPDRRFSYVEIAYFYRWWNQQTDIVRHIVQNLVNNGRLSFILGGWCMNDEASTHYNSIIDQHTRGLQFLQANFGSCGRPLVAWQIDPFGHSREQASLFAQMGYDAVYFARIDYQDYAVRSKQQTLEMLWQGSSDLGASSDLFTGALYEESYGSVVNGVDWDIFSGSPSMQDDPRLHDYNVDDIVNNAINGALEQAKVIRGNHLMWLMGSDFNYQNANTWFKNLDKLIRYTNMRQVNGSKVNLFYSTPSCYTLAKSRANLTWTTKSDDFFPYAHRPHGFWTGYFTSRAALKGMERVTNNYLQVVKQLDAWAQLGVEHSSDYKLDVLKRAMGVVQHHDGVSGTEKQVVAYDYAERLSEGVNECLDVLNDAYQDILQNSNSSGPLPRQQLCLLTNISMCNVSEQYDTFTIVVYNPLARVVSWWVRAPVSGDVYTVLDSNQQYVIPSQVVPVSPQTHAIPERNGSIAVNDLVFHVELPALGFGTYFVRPGQTSSPSKLMAVNLGSANAVNSDIEIKNEYLSLTFDGTTGFLSEIYNQEQQQALPLTQKLMYYQGFAGNNSADAFVPSGAYLFRPNGTDALSFGDSVQQISVIQGSLVQEVRQVFSPWASQVVRLYAGEQYAEFEWTIGPIPFSDGIGREAISRFTSSNLATKGMFYTDANGRQMMQRRRDFRPTWQLNQSEPIAGNYYPVNSRIFIQDEAQNLQLTVLTDRSQGGSSIHDGEVELMLHRVTINDDGLGVDEPLQEKGADGQGLVVRGRHLVFFDSIDRSQQLHRDMGLRTYMASLATFSNTTVDAQTMWLKNFATQGSAVTASLPPNVHILTAESWTAGTILLRLEHIYAVGESLGQPVTVQLKGLFKPFNVLGLLELTLSANQELRSASHLPFVSTSREEPVPSKPLTDFAITLEPMQIRTFQVRIA